MESKNISPETGRDALRALIKEKSPLGPLNVMAKHMGRFFQIPIPGFRPYVVFGPEAVRKVLVTERDKFSRRARYRRRRTRLLSQTDGAAASPIAFA